MKDEVNEINELVLKLVSTGLKSLAKGIRDMADNLVEDLPEDQAPKKKPSEKKKPSGESASAPTQKKPEQKKAEQKKPEQKKPEQKKAEQKKAEQKKPAQKKAAPKKPAAQKKPAQKKAKQKTAAEVVFKVVVDSEDGVNTAEIVEKTGFNSRKVWDSIKKLKKQGDIKNKRRGIYVST